MKGNFIKNQVLPAKPVASFASKKKKKMEERKKCRPKFFSILFRHFDGNKTLLCFF